VEPRSNERHRQTGEPAVPREDRHLSAAEARERSVEDENTPGAVQVRQNAGRRPPSEVREDAAEG
jgi:hypothetical protein